MNTLRYLVIGAGFALIASLATAAPQTATTPAADRWALWMGCWQLAEESVQDGAQLLPESPGSTAARRNRPRALVCVTPSDEGGATITTWVNDQPARVETIVADGVQRAISEQGCRGWQRAEWSALGARVFARAEISCENNAPRTVAGLSAMVSGPVWFDIQLIESQGAKSMRVRRYHRAADQRHASDALPPSPESATRLSRTLSLADIKEASAKVPPEALQAAVLELGGAGYDLDSKRLLELDAAGVPASVIDLMVAISFPKRFVVERGGPTFAGSTGGWDPTDTMWPYSAMWPYVGMWPSLAVPYAYYYTTFYRPFGYSQWGYYDPAYSYYGNPGVIVISPGGGIGAVESSGDGRVVDGHGYTRIRRNEPVPARTNNGNNRGWGTTSADGNGSSSSGSGTSGASSSGYSSGSSGSSGGRTAVPRPPG